MTKLCTCINDAMWACGLETRKDSIVRVQINMSQQSLPNKDHILHNELLLQLEYAVSRETLDMG